MRKTTKELLWIAAGSAAALCVGFTFNRVENVSASNNSVRTIDTVDTQVVIEETDVLVEDVEVVLARQQQEQITQQAAEDREELVAEGTKLENRSVISADGSVTNTGLLGLYLVDEIKGVSFNPTYDGVEGVNPQQCYAVAYETTASKSPLAIALANDVATAENAILGPSLNVQYGTVTDNGIASSVAAANGTMKMGIDPSFAGEGDELAVIAIYPGGATEILKDTDSDPTTLTVDIPQSESSLVMYSIIKYNK